MNLFITEPARNTSRKNPLEIQTPLGNLVFCCEFNGKIFNNPTDRNLLINNNTLLSSWQSDYYILEFLCFKNNPKLPAGINVDECIYGVWRVKILKELKISFCCSLKEELVGIPNSGEGLLATTFETEDYTLSIGTEDEDYLQNRAGSEWFPERLKSEINPNYLEYLPNGIKINLPNLFIHEQAQIHFIVSWANKKNDNLSTWFAVDQSLKETMSQMNIR
ncbi:MAG: hypothetical protein Q8K60_09750 [Parachlamydiaceae bacterium]|nr:hypothetical protein [Parachlamydiaceae bacterium]